MYKLPIKTKQPRLAIITSPFLVERNMEHVVYRLGEIFSTHFQVDIVGVKEASSRLQKSFQLYPPAKKGVLSRLPFFGTRISSLRQYLKYGFRPDAYIALSSIGINGLTAALMGRLTKVPSVIRVTSDNFAFFKVERPISKAARLFVKNNILGLLAIALADRTVLMHQAQLPTMTSLGFRENRFVSVPQPITFPPLENKQSKYELRKKLGLPEEAYIVGNVGTYIHRKNPKLLGKTLARVMRNRNDAFALLVGNGNQLNKVISHLDSSRVKHVPQVHRDDLEQYYRVMDVFLLTSKKEGLANVLLEALYFGVPVVSTPSGPITPEIVSNIGTDSKELASFIINESFQHDTLPTEIRPEHVENAWLNLMGKLIY
jgi:glycosyltransferase involved in cell wall biosynthesis